jgi:hypothetical protein
MSKLNPEEVGKIIGVFKAQIDVAIDVGHPSAGIHPQGKTKNGLVWQQRYANGDTDPGRLSATVIEHIRAEQVVFRFFSLSNHTVFGGEDTPKSEELDLSYGYSLSVGINGDVEATYTESDNAVFKRHLNGYSDIAQDDEDARIAHMEADDDFDVTRPIESGEIERVSFLLGQVVRV